MDNTRIFASEYMNWAKTQSGARFNLATSGLGNLRLRELEFSLDELEITTDYGYGYPPLLQALAGRLNVPAECVVTAAGTTFANHLAMAALINPGDEVWIEQPTYEPVLALARYLGAKVKRFRRPFEDGFQADLEELKLGVSNQTKLIVLTNLHNPTGVLLDQETLEEIGQVATANGSYILVDEVYLETFFERRPPTAFSLGQQFVVTSSLTKAYGLSGLRCGWIVTEQDLATRMWRLNDLFASTPVHVAERLSLAALRQLDRFATDAKQLLDRNRRMVDEFLGSRDDLECVRPSAGTIVFPRLKHFGNSEGFIKLLRDEFETSVVPGQYFEMPAHFRLGMAGDSQILAEGLSRIGQALDRLG
jgi:aspartate/methionine/tyrosine aminotransferase